MRIELDFVVKLVEIFFNQTQKIEKRSLIQFSIHETRFKIFLFVLFINLSTKKYSKCRFNLFSVLIYRTFQKQCKAYIDFIYNEEKKVLKV